MTCACETEQLIAGSTAYRTINFVDKSGAAAAPASISYRIDDLETGDEVLANTAFTPVAASIEITLTPTMNSLLNANREYERHRLTVIATYSGSDALVLTYDYLIVSALP